MAKYINNYLHTFNRLSIMKRFIKTQEFVPVHAKRQEDAFMKNLIISGDSIGLVFGYLGITEAFRISKVHPYLDQLVGQDFLWKHCFKSLILPNFFKSVGERARFMTSQKCTGCYEYIRTDDAHLCERCSSIMCGSAYCDKGVCSCKCYTCNNTTLSRYPYARYDDNACLSCKKSFGLSIDDAWDALPIDDDKSETECKHIHFVRIHNTDFVKILLCSSVEYKVKVFNASNAQKLTIDDSIIDAKHISLVLSYFRYQHIRGDWFIVFECNDIGSLF
jgi:hypothetical protein